MNALEVAGLKKNYAGFSLDVSFALEEGKITGFIGRNGAGKTTTIKSLLGFVHPDAGDIRFFSMPFTESEMKIKSRLGVVLGGVNYYPQKRLAPSRQSLRAFIPSGTTRSTENICSFSLLMKANAYPSFLPA